MAKLTSDKLKKLRDDLRKQKLNNYVKVGMSTCGVAAGADKVYDVLEEELKKREIDIVLKRCGCLGMCFAEPLVEVCIEGMPTVIYGKVTPQIAYRIVDDHILNGRIIDDYVYELRRKDVA